jgi:hypothetical protein
MTPTRKTQRVPATFFPASAASRTTTLALLSRARRHFRGAVAALVLTGAALPSAACGETRV